MTRKNINISVNQLVDFTTATESKKKKIILDQKSPDKFKIGWYQTPRACIKKSISNNGDIQPILDGIERLKAKIVTKPQQISNRMVSLEAMQKFLSIKIPSILKNHECEIIKERISKSIFINDVEIIISPDLIFKMIIKNKEYLGAVKLHISKGNVFELKKSCKVSTLLYKYMCEISDYYKIDTLPNLCFSIDIFGESIALPSEKINKSMEEFEKVCQEVKRIWYIVA